MKPDFFLDPELCKLPPIVRLFFQGLWLHADKEGRLIEEPEKLKIMILPYDKISSISCLEKLHPRFIIRYEVNTKRYIQIKNFKKHQHPHPKEPNSEIPMIPEGYIDNAVEKHGEPCKETAGTSSIVPCYGKGREGVSVLSHIHATEYKIETPLQKTICAWKIITGVKQDDRDWDKMYFARHAKSANALLGFFGGDHKLVIYCMKDIYRELKSRQLDCTIETVVKRASDWKVKNAKRTVYAEPEV